MGRGYIELFRQLRIGDDEFHILRQTLRHIVIDLIVGLLIAVERRRDQRNKYDQENREYLYDPCRELLHIGDQRFVRGLNQ